MTINDTAGLVVSIMTIVASLAATVRWLVKHYLTELRPNSGGSMKDQVSRLEEKVDKMYEILLDHIAKGKD